MDQQNKNSDKNNYEVKNSAYYLRKCKEHKHNILANTKNAEIQRFITLFQKFIERAKINGF